MKNARIHHQRPTHESLSAAGQGVLVGTAIAVPLAFAVTHFGPVALVAAAIGTGVALITLANALKRREQRNVNICIKGGGSGKS